MVAPDYCDGTSLAPVLLDAGASEAAPARSSSAALATANPMLWLVWSVRWAGALPAEHGGGVGGLARVRQLLHVAARHETIDVIGELATHSALTLYTE